MKGGYFIMEDEQKSFIKGAIAGDKESLTKLIEHYMEDILYFSTLYSKRQEAEDIAQNVALLLCEKMHTLSDPDSFIKWLSVVVRNASNQHMRQMYKMKDYVELKDSLEMEEDIRCDAELFSMNRIEFLPEKYVENEELRNVIIQEIDKLPQNQRLCLSYYYLYEMKRSEIAEVTGLTPRQVSTGLNYGKQKLKVELEKRFGTSFAYSVVPVGALPALAQAFQANKEALAPKEWCEQVTKGILDQLAAMNHVAAGSGALSSTAIVTCIAGVVVVASVMAAVVFSGEEEAMVEAVPSVVEVTQQEYQEVSVLEEESLQDRWEIRTIEDMIGQEEADRLERFVNSVDDPEEWQQFIQRIGAEEGLFAVQRDAYYTTYILEKQNKRLLLAQQEAADGTIRAIHIFGDRDEPMPAISVILLRLED